MKIDELKNLATREPFRPFTVNLLNGDGILIDSPAALLFPKRRPELVIAFSEDGKMHIFEDVGITSLTEESVK